MARVTEALHPRHVLLMILAVGGLVVSAYLAAYELDLLSNVWDPVFGASSSARVLNSRFARATPAPDALLGVLGYAVELGLLLLRNRAPHADSTGVVLLLVAAAMGLAAVGLVLLQATAIGAWCASCLLSAGISLAILLATAAAEARPALHLAAGALSRHG